MERILLIAVIVLPLVIFLAMFAGDVLQMNTDNSATATNEAQALLDLVTNE